MRQEQGDNLTSLFLFNMLLVSLVNWSIRGCCSVAWRWRLLVGRSVGGGSGVVWSRCFARLVGRGGVIGRCGVVVRRRIHMAAPIATPSIQHDAS